VAVPFSECQKLDQRIVANDPANRNRRFLNLQLRVGQRHPMRELVFIHGAGGAIDDPEFGSEKLIAFLKKALAQDYRIRAPHARS
jgi:hypothetical protein